MVLKEENSKFVLYIGGGVMAGIFGAGVVTALEEENVYSRIEAVYGSSVGAIIGAYFLANQSRLGSSIFYEDLIHDFITPIYIPLGIWDRIWNRVIAPVSYKDMRNPIDIDYVMNIIENKKNIDLNAFKSKKIPLYAHVLSLKNWNTEFINVTNHASPLRILRASISAAPYYFSEDREYIDGAIFDHFPITEIATRHSDKKIIAVINIVPNKLIRRSIKSFLEALVSSVMYSTNIFSIYLMRDLRTSKEIKEARKNSNILISTVPKGLVVWPNTINKTKLLNGYEAGIKEGKRVAGIIKRSLPEQI